MPIKCSMISKSLKEIIKEIIKEFIKECWACQLNKNYKALRESPARLRS